MKQTAVEWLDRWFRDNPEATHEEGNNALEQAKEMEKQQIIDAFYIGADDACYFMSNGKTEYKNAEQYYNETYVSKGSDDNIVDTNEMIEKSEKPILIHGEHQIQMVEISDEQIRSAANNVKSQTTFYSFIEGAKWYREQLKNKI